MYSCAGHPNHSELLLKDPGASVVSRTTKNHFYYYYYYYYYYYCCCCLSSPKLSIEPWNVDSDVICGLRAGCVHKLLKRDLASTTGAVSVWPKDSHEIVCRPPKYPAWGLLHVTSVGNGSAVWFKFVHFSKPTTKMEATIKLFRGLDVSKCNPAGIQIT